MTTTFLNIKISEFENKIPNTNNLVTTTILNTRISEVENKIPDHAKHITIQEFNSLTAENYAARLKQADFVNKFDFEIKLLQMKQNI